MYLEFVVELEYIIDKEMLLKMKIIDLQSQWKRNFELVLFIPSELEEKNYCISKYMEEIWRTLTVGSEEDNY